ncbi:MAG: DUF6728 family protein, partial [Bacteroidota bacterium]
MQLICICVLINKICQVWVGQPDQLSTNTFLGSRVYKVTMKEIKNQWDKIEKKKKVNYFDFSEVLTYFFRKKDPNRPKSFNLKAMHTINKISIL